MTDTNWDEMFDAMGPLERIIYLRDRVATLCQVIDAGHFHPSEYDLMDVAELVAAHAGPLAHDLLCKIASRSVNGRAVLERIKQ